MNEEEFKTLFGNMPSYEQYRLLSSIVSSSDDYLKFRMKNLLDSYDSLDILSLLPPELQLHLLLYVDGCSLLKACQVSKTWNKIIKSFNDLWKAKSSEIGVCIADKPDDWSWEEVFIASTKQLDCIKVGGAFSDEYIDLDNERDVIKVLDYSEGFICTVSEENHVVIWVLHLNAPILAFRVTQSVSCIKFKPFLTLVCGHFSGCLSSWSLSEVNSIWAALMKEKCIALKNFHPPFLSESYLQNTFEVHRGPVFSCDFCEDLNVLVSGGGENMIKFWNLRNGQLVHSIDSGGRWVLKVVLLPNRGEWNRVIAMKRESVDNYQWPKNSSSVTYDNSDTTEYFKNLKHIKLENSVPLNECKDNYTIPGFQINEGNIGLIIQDWQEKYSNLNVYDLDTFELRSSVSLNFKVRKFLAMGKLFTLFLSVGKTLFTSTLIVVNTTTGDIYGTHTVPQSKMTTPDGSQLVIGETRWLDGLRGWDFFDKDISEDHARQYPNESHEDCQECFKEKSKKRLQSLNSGGNFLIFTSGLRSENGKFYSLWWRRLLAKKTKKE